MGTEEWKAEGINSKQKMADINPNIQPIIINVDVIIDTDIYNFLEPYTVNPPYP